MPFIFALLASVTVHVGVLLTDGWMLPGVEVVDDLDVVLMPPASPLSQPTVAKPVVKSPDKVIKKSLPRPSAANSSPVIPEAPSENLAASPVPTPAPAPVPAAAPVMDDIPPPQRQPASVAVNKLAAKGRVRYDITRGESGLLIGQAIYRWEHDGKRYTASSQTETIGLAAFLAPGKVVQESSGAIDAAGLHPERFRHEQKKRSDTAEVDREQAVVRHGDTLSALGDRAAVLQDMLSMYFQLSLQLAESGGSVAAIRLPIMTGRKLDDYLFDLIGEETIERRFTRFSTRHIRTRNREDVIDLWFAPNLPLPLRIRFVDRKGDVYDQWLDINDEGTPRQWE